MPTDAISALAAQSPAGAGRTGRPAARAEAGDRSGVLSSDFETFLLMLTTQLENQDSLNPIESEEFAVQLATFSGVEQQVLTNQLLRDLAGGLGAAGLSQLAGWVGMEARVIAPVAFDGAPVDISPDPDPGSDRAELVVRDPYGLEVARQQVPLGVDTITWAGVGSDGRPLASGDYTLELDSFNQGELTGTRPVAHYAAITEARQGPEGIELVLAGGAVVASDAVTALRSPEAL